MSDTPAGPGWWQASDGRWYPPAGPPTAPPSAPTPAPLPPSLAKGTPAPPPSVDAGQAGGSAPYPPGATPPPGPGTYGPSTAPPGYPPAGAHPPGGYPPGGGYPPPGGGYPPPPGGYPPPGKGGNGMIVAVVAIFLVIVLGGGVAAFFLTRDSGNEEPDDPPSTTEGPPEAEPLLLQRVDDAGPDPFGASFADSDLPELAGAALDAAEERRSQLATDRAIGALVGTGDEPGLYGGSRDNRVCDALAIADFLESDSGKRGAFAEVLGISPAGIRDYLGSLTPVILASDTWVTNHGFAEGEATSFQAVLEAGTAVLVDDTGVPRVRCSCGNPLTLPEREGRSTEATEGDAWDGFEPGQVTVVEPGSRMSTMTLIDAETGEEFDRAVGAGQTGDVQVTLQWTGDADLDLHVFDPEGFEIDFAEKVSPSGGELDVDVIPGCDTPPEPHTENVFWPTGTAPPGDYRVVVDSYDGCGGDTDFELQVVVDGVVEISETGTAPLDGETTPYAFTV